MAGSQIVLHERDNGAQNRKDETRNIGLQSIVNRENSEVSGIISDANKQKSVALDIITIANKLTKIAYNLDWIADSISEVLQIIYMRRDKWTGMETLVSQAQDIINNQENM